MSKLNSEQVQLELAKVAGWKLTAKDEIIRTFKLSGFMQALTFVGAVGLLAEAAQHHPDITINYQRVTLALTTHDDGGLSLKDFDMAGKIDKLPVI